MKIKKIIAISAAVLCLIGMVGCNLATPFYNSGDIEEPTVGKKDNDKIYIWTDEDTGVQYIIYREKSYNAGFGGITPRLNPDGSLYCVEPTTEDSVSP